MWYFTWILGLGFAASFAILNAMWLELNPAPSKANSRNPTKTKMSRIISLILAGAASIIGLTFPFILGRQATGTNKPSCSS